MDSKATDVMYVRQLSGRSPGPSADTRELAERGAGAGCHARDAHPVETSN